MNKTVFFLFEQPNHSKMFIYSSCSLLNMLQHTQNTTVVIAYCTSNCIIVIYLIYVRVFVFKKGDGYIDKKEKMQKIINAVEQALKS